jgi:molecular chaperone GrpE
MSKHDHETPPPDPAAEEGKAGAPAPAEATPLPDAIAAELQELRAKAAELDGLRQKAKERDDFLALAQRVQADFSNYQKRIAAEKEQWGKFLHADLLRDLLPALDALDACATNAARGGEPASHLEGYRIASKELARILEKNGLVPIATTEGDFDPSIHEAVGMVEDAGRPAQSVVALARKGYRLHERVLRPAQVLVSRKPAEPETAQGPGSGAENTPDGSPAK